MFKNLPHVAPVRADERRFTLNVLYRLTTRSSFECPWNLSDVVGPEPLSLQRCVYFSMLCIRKTSKQTKKPYLDHNGTLAPPVACLDKKGHFKRRLNVIF